MNTKTIFDKAYLNFSNEITSTTSRGDAFTAYTGQGPVRFLGQLSDAAINKFYFLDAVEEVEVPQGTPQVVVRKRKVYPSATTINFDSSEPTTSNMSNFGTDMLGSVIITPVQAYKAVPVTGYAELITDRNLIKEKVDELTNGFGDLIDSYISTGLSAATETTATVAGAMTIYAGAKTSDAALLASDKFSVSLLNKARGLLEDKYAYYWNSGVWTQSSGEKNQWENELNSPFVCIVGPKQAEALLESGQLLNASQYGNNMPISQGEIGRTILGVVIIKALKNVKRAAAGGTAIDGGDAPTVNISRCILMKGRKAYQFVWFKKPQFLPWADARLNQKGVALSAAYGGSVIFEDAIIKIDCAD